MTNVLALQKARAAEVLSDPEALETVCAFIADGGTLVGFCKEHDLRSSDVTAWLYAIPSRKEAFEFAVRARGEWTVEHILEELRMIATMDVESPDTKARYADKLKAIELLGKKESLFTERVEHEVKVDLAEQIKKARERVRAARLAEGGHAQ